MADTGRVIVDVDGNLKPLKGRLAKLASSHKMTLDEKGFTQPLGRITGKLGEFDKSLDASNARVVAFGASAGAIYAVQRALSETVRSAISVEKTLADINVILNVSNKSLERFSDRLFKVAGQTGQSFQSVAEAATELARQGLSVEQTLKRTSDALVLTRLSGMSATQSVETLTAAINSFSKSALTSTEIINKLANVDAAFAVSTNDLAEALRRVGSSAADANISFDQLVAAVTSAQQTTARGGAVIGNSFKTIFTRLQRPRVLQQLEMLGIKTRDLGGETKPVINILQSLAKQYDKLSTAQKSQITELIGGVFQINIVKAALSDLGKEYSVYERALQTSVSSTDEAIKRNEKLNETLSALVNKTFANLQKAAAGIGEGVFGPSMRSFLDTLNAGLEGGDTDGEGIGAKIGKGIFKGIENVISGPGLVLAFAGLTKIIARLGSTTGDAFKTLVLQTNKSKERESFERAIEQRLRGQDGYMDQIVNGTMSVEDAHQLISKQIDDENRKLDIQAGKVREIAGLMQKQGFFAFSDKKERPVKRKAGGLVPDKEERRMAAEGGYTAGLTRRTRISPGLEVITNSRENIKQFPGMKQKAVLPPAGSRAADAYRQDFMSTHGFDPYAGKGFVPNFFSKAKYTQQQRASVPVGAMYYDLSSDKMRKKNKGKGGKTLSRGDFINTGNTSLSMSFAQLQRKKGSYDFSRKAIGAKYYTGPMTGAADPDDTFSLQLKFLQHKDSLQKLRGKGFNFASWEDAVNRTFGASGHSISNYPVDGIQNKNNAIESKFLSNIGKINNKKVGTGYYASKLLAHRIASSKDFSIQDGNRQNYNLGTLSIASPYSRNYKKVASGFVPQFASKSDEEIKQIIRQKLQAGSVQGFNNDRYQRLIASDPTLRGMYDTVMASKQQSRAASEAGRAERKATAAARPRLNVLFAKNLSGVDLGKSAVAGYGFSSKMPNAKRNFDTSFLRRYPNMVRGIGYDMFKSMPGTNPIKTRNMMKQFNVSALDPAARGQVSGRVFESFIKAMSTQIIPGQETGSERIDMKRHQLKPAYRSLFTKGAATNLGHHGSEIRFGDITTSKAMQKQGYAGGFVPNFNAVNRAMETERMMGGDPEFRQFPFPHVADKSRQKDFRAVLRDHPNLSRDMRRSKEMQESMFGAQGHVPNFILPALATAGRLGMGALKGAGRFIGIGGSKGGKAAAGATGMGELGAAAGDTSNNLIAMAMMLPMVTGSLEGMASEGDKTTKIISSSTNAFASAAVAYKTMPGKLGKAITALAAFGGISEGAKIFTDRTFELGKALEKATEQMTTQTNASQIYLSAQENLTTALAEAVPDEEKISKLRDQMMGALSDMTKETQREVIAATNATEARDALEKANAELAKKTQRVAKQVTLSNLQREGTFLGLGLGGSAGAGFGSADTAKNFASQFAGGASLQGLDKKQRDELVKAFSQDNIDLTKMDRAGMVQFFEERIKLESEYVDLLPEGSTQLGLTAAALQKLIETYAKNITETKELIEANRPYREEIERQQKIITQAKNAIASFNEGLSTLMATIFDQASKSRKFRADTMAGSRRLNLGIAESRLQTMRPFMGEDAIANSEFRLQQANRQEDTASRMRQAEFDSNQKINEIVTKMAKTVTSQLGQGGTTAGLSEQQRAASTRFRVGAFNMVQSGLRGDRLAKALDKLTIQSLGGTREQVPQAITELKTELLKASLDQQNTLAEIARTNHEQKTLQEKQFQEQKKQIEIQRNLGVQGGARAFMEGGTDMMSRVARNQRVFGFARRTGNLELAGRGALAINQDIKDLTGRETTFGRGLAIRGNALRLSRNANLAGFGMSGSQAFNISRDQIDSMIKPVRSVSAVERAAADSASLAKSMGPVLQKAFVEAWHQTGTRIAQQQMNMYLSSIARASAISEQALRIIAKNKGNIQTNKSEGYIPNFNAIKGYGVEKNNVMRSSQYTPSQKMRARPMRRIINGQPTWMNDQESLVRNFMGSGKDAVLTPKMMGMAAEGYIPNFNRGIIPFQGILEGGNMTFGQFEELYERKTKRDGYHKQHRRFARGAFNQRSLASARQQMAESLLKMGRKDLLLRMYQGPIGLPPGWSAATNVGSLRMPQGNVARPESFYNQRGIRTRSRAYNLGRSIGRRGAQFGSNIASRLGAPAARMAARGAAAAENQRAVYMALQRMRGKMSPEMYAKAYGRFAKNNIGLFGSNVGVGAAKYGSKGAFYAAKAAKGWSIVGAGDLIGRGLGMGMENLIGRKLSADDKRVFGGGWDSALDFTGLTSIARATKTTGGLFGAWADGGWSIAGPSAQQRQARSFSNSDLRRKYDQGRKFGRYRNETFAEFKKAYLRGVAYNRRQEKRQQGTMTRGFAGGYIPNFAQMSSLGTLFSASQKAHHQERSRFLGMTARYGSPGLGWLSHPSLSSKAMQTPGLRREMLRRAGVTGGEQFRSYPTIGRFASEGIINSQMRERRQSGMSDVYTKFVNTPRYKGLATFNGTERGMEEMVVNSHPNPSRAGYAAEGQVPNFASLTKRLESVSESIGALNENMSAMNGAGQASESSSQGSVSLSMQPLNISINHSGNLTTQMSEVQNQLVAALDGAISSSMPGVYNALKGPSTS